MIEKRLYSKKKNRTVIGLKHKYSILKYFILIVLAFTLNNDLLSQSPVGEFREVFVLSIKDTVYENHSYGDWWFGIYSGGSSHHYFGELLLRPSSDSPDLNNNPLLPYKGGSGFGYFFGFEGQWVPQAEFWGAGLKLYVLDKRSATNSTETYLINQNDVAYTTTTDFYYIVVSPSARYNFLLKGLHGFGGFDIEIPINTKTYRSKEFKNTGNISQSGRVYLDDINIRFGVNVGLAYDIFGGEIGDSRIIFTPFISMHAATNVLSMNNSNWNNVFFRGGFAIKFGPDKILYDTIPFDPFYESAPIHIASAGFERGIEYPGYIPQTFISADLGTKGLPQVNVVYRQPELARSLTPKVEQPPKEIKTDKAETFFFKTSASTELSQETNAYLDNIAEFIKSNPYYEVRIVGHSDNFGTLEENQKRAEIRARKVVNYLLNKGVSRGSLLMRGQGSRKPIADNNTKEGRKKNRRVEIRVVKSSK